MRYLFRLSRISRSNRTSSGVAAGAGAGTALRVERVEGLAQLEQRLACDHVVDHHRQLGLPARGHAAHTIGHGVDLHQQPPAFVEQLVARGGELGLARAAVEQQHVERVFELAHAVGQRRGHLAELARRGHDVSLLDRYGPANQLSSSSGPTRIWRLSHPDRLRVRAEALAARVGGTVVAHDGRVGGGADPAARSPRRCPAGRARGPGSGEGARGRGR